MSRIAVTFMFAAALSQPVLAQTNLIVNGGFELPAFTQPFVRRAQATTFGSWNVDNLGNGVAHVGSFGRPLAVEGAQCIELNWFVSGGLNQTIPTVPGQTYIISFLMAGQTDIGADLRQIRVDFGGTTAGVVSWSRSATGGNWVRQTVFGHATAGTSVADFVGITPANVDGGPYIDDVRIVQCLDFTQQPESRSVCPGANVTLTFGVASAPTDGSVNYRWQVEDSNAPGGWRDVFDGPVIIAGQTAAIALGAGTSSVRYTMFLPDGTPLRSRCVASNSCGSLASAPATLTLKTNDLNLDGNTDQDDIAYLINVVGGGPNPSVIDPDLNSDGNVDQDDVAALINWVAGGGCP